MKHQQEIFCSHCGKPKQEAQRIVVWFSKKHSTDVALCDECIGLFADIISEYHSASPAITLAEAFRKVQEPMSGLMKLPLYEAIAILSEGALKVVQDRRKRAETTQC